MNVMDKDHTADDVSIVSGSTIMNDVTQNLQIPMICNNSEKVQAYVSLDTERNMNTGTSSTADGCEMSPLVPLQVAKYVQKSPPLEDCDSEVSEVLIPLVSRETSTTVLTSTKCSETQESQLLEGSQSLLPQLPVRSCLSTLPVRIGCGDDVACNQPAKGENSEVNSSQSTISPTVISGFKQHVETECEASNGFNVCSEITVKTMKALKNVNTKPDYFSVTLNDHADKRQHLTKHTLTSENSDTPKYLKGQTTAAVFQSTKLQNKHDVTEAEAKNDVHLSHSLALARMKEVEISRSQGSVSLASLEKDPVGRIIARLDRLVSSLDTVSTRQRMVMEATILQCITSLQDSLNNKLKKKSSAGDTAGILKKLLQTTQNGLMKLAEQHKLEKCQLAQMTGTQSTEAGTQSTQQTYQWLQNQSAVSDLGKRQKRVFSLLKRQKYLMELYKTTKRPVAEADVTASQYSYQYEIYEENARRQMENSCKNETDNQGVSRTKRGRAASEEVLDKSSKSHIKKTSKYLNEKHVKCKLNKNDLQKTVSENVADMDNRETQCNNVTSIESEEGRLNTDTQHAEFGNCHIPEEVMAVPDTQEEFNTQDTIRTSVKDIFIDRESSTAESEDHLSKYTEKELERRVNVQETKDSDDTVVRVSVSFGIGESETSNTIGEGRMCERGALKRDKTENIGRNENVKKQKLNEGLCVNNAREKTAINTKDKTVLSEVLWLNILRNDTDKPIQNADDRQNAKVIETFKQRELFTAKKLNTTQELSNITRDALSVRNDKTEFQFTKPTFLSKPEQEDFENTFAVPKENQKRECTIARKTDKCSEASYNITERKREETNVKEVKIAHENDHVLDCLASPPKATVPGETWHNVSPTATSMSSDVFMVKVKDLQKRMKRRAILPQNINLEKIQPIKTVGKGHDNEEVHAQAKAITGQEDVVEKFVRNSENSEYYTGSTENDSISEAIDSVIKQSREIAARKESADNYTANLKQMFPIRTSPCVSTKPDHFFLKDNYISEKDCSKQCSSRLPTLKDLVQYGQLIPGKAALSCHLKGKSHRASLTHLGKIRTQEGLNFANASQWVSTLTDGVPIKKRKAYEMVLYKGRQLLSFCKDCTSVHKLPTSVVQDNNLHPRVTRSSVDQGIQVEDSELISRSPKMSEDEKQLNVLLSGSVVRLLTEQDFVPCDDLPDNFWTEDFSKVKLHRDVWETVDAW